MSRVRFWTIAMVVLVFAGSIVAPRVESWSEPVYTKPWTEAEEPEQPEEDLPLESPEEPESELVEEKASEAREVETETSVPEIDEFLLDFENLYGTWYIWTPGTAINMYDTNDGEYVTHEFVPGAEQGIVEIRKDGTYSMSHGAWDQGTVVEGEWRLSYPREINGEVLQAIVLLDGITGTDWAVAPSSNRKIRLLWAMEWADGSATWIFDSELYKK